MKHRTTQILVWIYFILTFIMYFFGLKIHNTLLKLFFLFLYLGALWLLISWRTINGIWVCDECKEGFKITLWDNIQSFSFFSLKNRLYYRFLYCPKSKKKTWCRCTFEE